jgi:hypothetical protein
MVYREVVHMDSPVEYDSTEERPQAHACLINYCDSITSPIGYLRKLRFDLIISFLPIHQQRPDIPISSSDLMLLLQPFEDIAIAL